MSSLVAAMLWDQTIQSWLDDYPPHQRHELERRLASRERVAALFELLLHAILKRHGAQVLVHPRSVSKTATRPDFLAVFPDGHEVVVEATTVNELSKEEVSTSNAWTELLKHINRIESDFWIDVDIHPGPLPNPPPPKEVKAFLERELAKLDVTIERARLESRTGWQGLLREFVSGETILTFWFSPKMPIHRGTTVNIAGLGGYMWDGAARGIEDAVSDKRSRYGELDQPYVLAVAVNAPSPWDYAADYMEEALWGNPSHGRDGALRHGGKTNRLVSGVAACTLRWDLHQMRIILHENPCAERSVSEMPWRLDRKVGTEAGVQLLKGQSVGEVLGLPVEWPRAAMEPPESNGMASNP